MDGNGSGYGGGGGGYGWPDMIERRWGIDRVHAGHSVLLDVSGERVCLHLEFWLCVLGVLGCLFLLFF